MKKNNYSMLMDFYELTMANGYFEKGLINTITYFDVFYRDNPDGAGFAIFAGLESIIDYIKNLSFDKEDIEFLRSKKIFSEGFLDYLAHFKFSGDIYAVEEGTVVFPREPLITVRANAVEAQLIETYLLLAVNHESLITTKASRIVRSAKGRPVMEFGSRRAHGATSAIVGARCAYIAGAVGTACALSEEEYGVPALGTMAHSWVQMFESEYDAFIAYCKLYPTNAVLLVDTYDVLKSGVPNAIKAFKEVLVPQGILKGGIRIDSGDISYLSQKARKMFDDAGLPWVKICASNGLDERLITTLIDQGAKVDSFGVGERLITSASSPVFGAVYKLSAIEKEGKVLPKIKISENSGKMTNPHFKKTYRFYDKNTNKALADLICVYDEDAPSGEEFEIFDPIYTWKRKTLTNFYVQELQRPIFVGGKLIYEVPSLEEVKLHLSASLDTLWEEVKRFENPNSYYVDLSEKLWKIKNDLINNERKKKNEVK